MTYNLPMPNRRLSRRWILPTLLLVLTQSAHSQIAGDFVGEWVIKLGQRTLLVLTITAQEEAQSSIAGFIVRPQRFRTSDGRSFSKISRETIQEPIVRSELKDGQLTITVRNPKDASDEDSYQISLADSTHLKLKMFGPIDPLILIRTQETLVPATDWEETRTYSDEDSAVSNPEMQRIFEEDQKVRQPGSKIDWVAVSKSDMERREATRQLLNDGKLHTGEDFERAAFLFQHSSSSNDYLLAHTLAMVAVKKGQTSALWIASATLDRYLQSIHQPQIYGTQFFTRPNEPTTQEPYDRTLISDPLRRQLGVPSQPSQDERRKQYDAERSFETKP
jgi:hypothetical protein